MSLLSKTRSLNRLLQKSAGKPVNFMEMAEVLTHTIQANVYVISRKGKVLGFALSNPILSSKLQESIVKERRIPEEFNRFLINIDESTSNSSLGPETGMDPAVLEEAFTGKIVTIVPIIGGGDRLGTLLLVRTDDQFIDDDLVLAEYGATIVGMEVLRERAIEVEEEARSKAVAQVAVASLSYSESEAVEHIFEELKEREGLLVASKIADRVGITRSVIVNALRKLESAGVIETRSLGMKGTYIKILNFRLTDELKRARA